MRSLLPTGLVYCLFLHPALSQLTIPTISQLSVTDYAPITGADCPDISRDPLLRIFDASNQTLHPRETEYVTTREATVVRDAWKNWIGDGSALGYDLQAFQGKFPRVGIALPGGGLRAAQYGAACLNALDEKNSTAKAAGTGGLLQVASYITGLSGGSWATGSFVFSNWPKLTDLVFGDGKDFGGWLLDLGLVTPGGANILSKQNVDFFGSVLWSVMAKGWKGIDTSLTDPWARMISFHFLGQMGQTSRDNFFSNDTAHGAGLLWSKIPELPSYQLHQTPFPIVVANSRPSGSKLTTTLALDATVYEITPLEFASFDPALSAGMNLTFAGTQLVEGRPENGSSCVVGFDQAGFVMGTSASLFNQIFDFGQNVINGFSSQDSQGLLYVLGRQLKEVRSRADDVANWPSPFKGLRPDTFADSKADWLELLDGSSNQENVPYGPLFVKARGVDVIVTAEGSADIPGQNWPNGTGLIFTKARQDTILRSTHQPFPPIPATPEDFIATGVNSRPTFFGCDPKNSTDFPLVIYLPNAPPFTGTDPVTNTATFQLSYTQKHTHLFFDQVLHNLVSGFKIRSNEPDPIWGTCLKCAAIDRARLKVSPIVPRSDVCSQCFKQYCYDPNSPPTKADLPPNLKLNFVDPDPIGLDRVTEFLGKAKFGLIGGFIGLVIFICALVFGLTFLRRRKLARRAVEYQKAMQDDIPDPVFIYTGYNPTHHRNDSHEIPLIDQSQKTPLTPRV